MNTAQKRELSSQAQVAKLCRQYCKSIGVKCKATSDSFSMGDSVSVEIENQPPEIVKQINNEFSQYQYGHFDGMNDIYEYSNNRKDVPQTKYLSVNVKYDDELRQKAWSFIRNYYSGGDQFDKVYKNNNDWEQLENHNENISQLLWRTLNGSNDCGFWDTIKAVTKADILPITSRAIDVDQVEISEGTKPGYSEVRFPDKPNAETREALKAAGFRWSRFNGCWWGKTENLPAFDSEPAPPTGGNTPAPRKQVNHADKLRTLAEKLTPQIEAKHAPRQENTHKRRTGAQHARREGARLQRTQNILLCLADLHEADNVPGVLHEITTKKAVYELAGEKLEMNVTGDYYGTGEPSKTTPEAVAVWGLLTPKTAADKEAEKLADKITALQFSSIPGYFPTPATVIDLMINYADLQESDRVLEPNLGGCAIADRIAPMVAEVKGFEVNYTLADIAEAKDYLIEQRDFLTVKWEEITQYEKILMNPPFEKLQDIEHIQHAFQFLKEGGRLVAIMSPSAFFRDDKKSASFREWFDSLGGERVDLPPNSFKESGTGVNSVMVIIDN